MEISELDISGLLVIKPQKFQDERGFFMESFQANRYKEFISLPFLQDNISVSKRGVTRGLHLQNLPSAQGKLVQVLHGSVVDVAVDLRKSSPTFGAHAMIELSATNGLQFYIPPGFAHGFCSLENNTIFSYKCTEYYHPEAESCILWNDKSLNIDWEVNDPILSKKDMTGISFNDFISPF